MNQEIIEKAGKIIAQSTGEAGYCVLSLIDENGYPTGSTITPSKADGIKQITFCTGLSANSAKRAMKCNRAGVCFNTGGAYNITLVGTIEVVTETDIKHEMWYDGLKNHFSSADDPNFCVLRFTTERYNLLVDWKEAIGVIELPQ
jgi:general stress protein 26